MIKVTGRIAALALLMMLSAPTAALAQGDYTGATPPDAGSSLTETPPSGTTTGDGAEVQGRQFARPAAFSGDDSSFSFTDMVLGLPFLLLLLGLFLIFWLRRRRDEEEDEDEDGSVPSFA